VDRTAVFARYPVAGEVKTRLSPAVPATLAVDIYAGMLADALSVAADAGTGPPALYWASEPPEHGLFPIPAGVIARRQRGTDLGERLSAAFAELLSSPSSSPGDRAVVIGADCPDLAPEDIRRAFTTLGRQDVVLGPARDGGYYLIGLRREAPALFRGIAWGTGAVLAQTLERAAHAGLGVELLGALDDIDTPEDVVRFVARRSISPPGPGARTEAALTAMGLLPPRS
jgi:rSAM/selenodomain-associated transferase 1